MQRCEHALWIKVEPLPLFFHDPASSALPFYLNEEISLILGILRGRGEAAAGKRPHWLPTKEGATLVTYIILTISQNDTFRRELYLLTKIKAQATLQKCFR